MQELPLTQDEPRECTNTKRGVGSSGQTRDELDKIHDDVCDRFKNNIEVEVIRDRGGYVQRGDRGKLDWVCIEAIHTEEATLRR